MLIAIAMWINIGIKLFNNQPIKVNKKELKFFIKTMETGRLTSLPEGMVFNNSDSVDLHHLLSLSKPEDIKFFKLL